VCSRTAAARRQHVPDSGAEVGAREHRVGGETREREQHRKLSEHAGASPGRLVVDLERGARQPSQDPCDGGDQTHVDDDQGRVSDGDPCGARDRRPLVHALEQRGRPRERDRDRQGRLASLPAALCRVTLTGGRNTTVRLVESRNVRNRLRVALRQHRRALADVRISVSDPSGNRQVLRRTVRIAA
jgi:hypothetical protein